MLKKLIKNLITSEHAGPPSIFYFAFDIAGLKGAAEVKDAVISYIKWAKSLPLKKGRLWILLDEASIQTIDEFSPEDIFNKAHGASYYQDEIQSTFKKYLLAGGYPLSIIDLTTRGEITQGTYFAYQQAMLGDITKLGKNEAILRELIGGILIKSAEPITWQILQQTTGIGSHNTVEDYVRTLEALFVLYLLHQVRYLGGTEISFRKRKKIYFMDPFQYHCLGGWSSGYSNYFDFAQKIVTESSSISRLLEGVMAGHLVRHFPKLAFWRNRGEIDFICVSNGKIRMFAELKYQPQITSDDKKGLKKAKGGLLLTRNHLEIDETNHIYMVPIHLFLAVLPE